jgi:GT2 family glycosyltransferase
MRCLATIAELNYPDVNVIVVDNASTDGTAAAIRDTYPHVDLIELPANLGAVGASNIGFEQALANDAAYVLRLDSDTELAPSFLRELVAAAEVLPRAGILVGKVFYLDEPERIWSLGARFAGPFFGATDVGRDQLDVQHDDKPFRVDLAWSTGFLLTREALESTKGFDPDFFVYYEEVDLCLRLARTGLEIWCIPSARMWHRVGQSEPTAWTAYHWGRGKMLFYRKHSRGLRTLVLIVYAYLYALCRTARPRPGRGNRGPLLSALRGLTAGLRHPLS